MLRDTLLKSYPLRMFEDAMGNILAPGQMGAILARHGVGKTALLVQIALNAMLKGKNVLHVSLTEPVRKVMLWYEEIFLHLVGPKNREMSKPLFESILPHRFILTFKLEDLTIPRLEERINDLIVQGVFRPNLLIIDGLGFDRNVKVTVEEMKSLALKLGAGVWFSVPIHRHLEEGRTGIPLPVIGLEQLFSILLLLTSEEAGIRIKSLLGPQTEELKHLILDPSSLIINKAAE
ncbi:MAG: DnaB helicase C-terminal domain-containing protein [Syntrophales bacterium]|nr:DnaB helicase C-terminal domain-containing protein [Syntrophales bacterium]